MQDLFSFHFPSPLPEHTWATLRKRMGMRSHQKVPFFKGIAHLEWGLQAIMVEKEDGYQIIVQSNDAIKPERLIYWRSRVAQAARAAGSEDPAIEEAIKRQKPREQGTIRPVGRAARKRSMLDRLLLRNRD